MRLAHSAFPNTPISCYPFATPPGIGAVATAFLFPILLATIGTRLLLYGLIVAFILGAVVTWFYRIETTGVNLDSIGEAPAETEKPVAVA